MIRYFTLILAFFSIALIASANPNDPPSVAFYSNVETGQLKRYTTSNLLSESGIADIETMLDSIALATGLEVYLAIGEINIPNLVGQSLGEEMKEQQMIQGIQSHDANKVFTGKTRPLIEAQLNQLIGLGVNDFPEGNRKVVIGIGSFVMNRSDGLSEGVARGVYFGEGVTEEERNYFNVDILVNRFGRGRSQEENLGYVLEGLNLLKTRIILGDTEIKLQSVSFEGDYPVRDVEKPQWKNGDEIVSNPICYVRNTKANIIPNFSFTAEITGAVKIKAIINDATEIEDSAIVDATSKVITPMEEIQYLLPNHIDLVDPLKIDWYIIIDDGDPIFVGDSNHQIFVTQGEPFEIHVIPELLYFGCTIGEEITDEIIL